MRKPKIDKLKYPIWFNIVFYVLTVILPLVLVLSEGFRSPNKVFRITFGVIVGLILIWTFVYKFILAGKEKELKENKLKLEHEYSIEVGNKQNIKWLWFSNEQILSIFNCIQVGLFGSLLTVLSVAIAEGFMKIKAICIMITICYLVAYIIKFVIISVLKGTEKEVTNEEGGAGQ